MTTAPTKTPDFIEMQDNVHVAASTIDGLLTCAQSMQDEVWRFAKHHHAAKGAASFNEALTVALSCIREQVMELQKLAD